MSDSITGWQIGSIVAGRFTIEERIGAGALGVVYRVSEGGKTYALKALNPKVVPGYIGTKKIETVLKEHQFNHPGILNPLEVGEHDGLRFILQPFLHGKDLRSMLDYMADEDQVGDARLAANFLDHIATIFTALPPFAAHGALKPANILVEGLKPESPFPENALIYLSDFGTHHILSFSKYASLQLSTGPAYYYLAPEFISLGGKVDSRADQYSLGVLAYELLTGSVPRKGYKPITQANPSLNEEWDDFINRLLSKQPDHRFASFAELRQALNDLVGELPPPPKYPQPVEGITASAMADEATRQLAGFDALLDGAIESSERMDSDGVVEVKPFADKVDLTDSIIKAAESAEAAEMTASIEEAFVAEKPMIEEPVEEEIVAEEPMIEEPVEEEIVAEEPMIEEPIEEEIVAEEPIIEEPVEEEIVEEEVQAEVEAESVSEIDTMAAEVVGALEEAKTEPIEEAEAEPMEEAEPIEEPVEDAEAQEEIVEEEPEWVMEPMPEPEPEEEAEPETDEIEPPKLSRPVQKKFPLFGVTVAVVGLVALAAIIAAIVFAPKWFKSTTKPEPTPIVIATPTPEPPTPTPEPEEESPTPDDKAGQIESLIAMSDGYVKNQKYVRPKAKCALAAIKQIEMLDSTHPYPAKTRTLMLDDLRQRYNKAFTAEAFTEAYQLARDGLIIKPGDTEFSKYYNDAKAAMDKASGEQDLNQYLTKLKAYMAQKKYVSPVGGCALSMVEKIEEIKPGHPEAAKARQKMLTDITNDAQKQYNYKEWDKTISIAESGLQIDDKNAKLLLLIQQAKAAKKKELEATPEKTPEVVQKCPVGMVYVSGGSVRMGSSPNDPMRKPGEKPNTPVYVAPYCVDMYEYPNKPGQMPKVNVTWSQAQQLCAAQGKRLCTEREWERSCKGPGNRRYPYGNNFNANVCATEDAGGNPRGTAGSGSWAGCRSSFGIYDMSGNVREWTSSTIAPGQPAYIVKGGAANQPDYAVRCAIRQAANPGTASHLIGFRCCSNPEE